MNITPMKNAVTSMASRKIMLVRKNSPTLMFAAGVAGVVGTTVLACKATLRLEEVLDTAAKNRKIADEMPPEIYSDRDRKHDHALIYVRTAAGVVKLYLPAVAMGTVSVALLTGSHVVLTRRNVALTAAYKIVSESFDNYRRRVREDVGEDQEQKYYHDLVPVHDTEKGKIGLGKRFPTKEGDPDRPGASMYSKLFDETNQNWQRQSEYNLLFLRAQQNYANERLHSRGHLFLNEVYEALGLEHTSAGAVVGWVKGNGDDYVDFGVFDRQDADRFFDFMVGKMGIWLDFNVDGVIYDKI